MDLTPRQAELADVALGIVGREGMAAVTFRSVAAESGWSLGAVQKAYSSKSELLRAMFSRLRETAAPLPPGPPGRPTLRVWLVELTLRVLPLDAPRRAAELQGSAFAERAAYDPDVGAAIAASDGELRLALAGLVRRAQAERELPGGLDPVTVARGYLAFAQGLATQLLYDPVPEAEARRLVDATIARLLGVPTEP